MSPTAGTDVNIAVVINTPGADYVNLGSFGTPTMFGQNLVTSMDRSFMRKGNNVPADMLVRRSDTQTLHF